MWTEREYNNPLPKDPLIFPVSMFVTFVTVEIESKTQTELGLKLILSTPDFHILLMSLELNRGLILLTMGHWTWQQSTSRN